MSDLETIREMLQRASIDFTEEITAETTGVRHLKVERGYIGFISEFEFDEAGNLVDLNAWE